MKKCLCKLVAAISAISVTFGVMPMHTATFAADAASASAEFSASTPNLVGISTAKIPGGASAEVVTYGDSSGWNLNSANTSIGLVLDDTFKHSEKDGSVYEIEVDYYDSGEGFLMLYYDSYTSTWDNISGTETPQNSTQTAATAYTTGENKWKTLRAVVDDAAFAGRLDPTFSSDGRGGYDLAVSVSSLKKSNAKSVSKTSVAVSEVRIVRKAGVYPVYVTPYIDETGNTFKWFSENKIIHNKIENLTSDTKNVNITFRAVSEDGMKSLEKAQAVTLAAGGNTIIDFNAGELDYCGMYKYYIEVNDTGGLNSVRQPIEFYIIKTDPNGVKNQDVYYVSHIEDYGRTRMPLGAEVVSNSNSAGVRGSWYWDSYERTAGEFSTVGKSDSYWLDAVKEAGLEYYPHLGASNPNYYNPDCVANSDQSNYWKYMPVDDAGKAAFRTYVHKSAEHLHSKGIDTIAVFNEMNISSFNAYIDMAYYTSNNTEKIKDAAQKYVDCLQIVYDEVQSFNTANNANMKVAGPVLCGLEYQQGYMFFDACMDCEMWKYMDVLDLHPYTTDFVENSFLNRKQSKLGNKSAIRYYVDELKKANPDKTYELWYSEIGYTTAGDEGANVQDSYTQGAMNAASYLYYKSAGLGDKFCFYNLEQKGSLKTEVQDNYGQVSPGYSGGKEYGTYFVPRKSYMTHTVMNYYMAQTTPVSYKYSDDAGFSLYTYGDLSLGKYGNLAMHLYDSAKFNKQVLAVYSMTGARTVTLDLGTAKSVILADENGNETELRSDNGCYTFTANKAPVYILGDISDYSLLNSTDANAVNVPTALSVPKYSSGSIDITAPNGCIVEADFPEAVYDKTVTGITNGQGNVTFWHNANEGDVLNIVIRLKNGDNIISQNTVKVTAEAAEIEANAEMPSRKIGTSFTSAVTVKNNTASGIGGSAKIGLSDGTDTQPASVTIGGGASATVSLTYNTVYGIGEKCGYVIFTKSDGTVIKIPIALTFKDDDSDFELFYDFEDYSAEGTASNPYSDKKLPDDENWFFNSPTGNLKMASYTDENSKNTTARLGFYSSAEMKFNREISSGYLHIGFDIKTSSTKLRPCISLTDTTSDGVYVTDNPAPHRSYLMHLYGDSGKVYYWENTNGQVSNGTKTEIASPTYDFTRWHHIDIITSDMSSADATVSYYIDGEPILDEPLKISNSSGFKGLWIHTTHDGVSTCYDNTDYTLVDNLTVKRSFGEVKSLDFRLTDNVVNAGFCDISSLDFTKTKLEILSYGYDEVLKATDSVVVAIYQGDTLKNVKIYNMSDGGSGGGRAFDLSAFQSDKDDADMIKAFVWRDMQPMTKMYEVKNNRNTQSE